MLYYGSSAVPMPEIHRLKGPEHYDLIDHFVTAVESFASERSGGFDLRADTLEIDRRGVTVSGPGFLVFFIADESAAAPSAA